MRSPGKKELTRCSDRSIVSCLEVVSQSPGKHGTDSSGWSFLETGLQISCDFILLECQNSSNDVPKNVCTITYRFRGSYFYHSGEVHKAMSGREAEARAGEGGEVSAAGAWHACISILARLPWGLWCGPLLAGQRSFCPEESNVDMTGSVLTLVTPAKVSCAPDQFCRSCSLAEI